MLQITQIDDTPQQSLVIVDENGNNITMNLRFLPTQNAWNFDISFGTFNLNGCRLVNSLNILRSYKNQLPFGIACLSNDGCDPFLINDFSTNRVGIYTLIPQDLETIEGIWQV